MNNIKLLLLTGLSVVVAFFGCQQKSVPVITARKTAPLKLQASVYAAAGTVQVDTVQGKTIFMARCSRCHGLPQPASYTINKWENILMLMIPRSRIDTVNAVHVRAYVLAHALKP
jgi:cytochrome c5